MRTPLMTLQLNFSEDKLTTEPPNGNGRFVENLIHEAIQQQALRLMDMPDIDSEQMNSLTKEDIAIKLSNFTKGRVKHTC